MSSFLFLFPHKILNVDLHEPKTESSDMIRILACLTMACLTVHMLPTTAFLEV